MTQNNGSVCTVTPWIKEHAQQLTEWESQTRYNFEYYLELNIYSHIFSKKINSDL